MKKFLKAMLFCGAMLTATASLAAQPTFTETFGTAWTQTNGTYVSPDGRFKVDGPWTGTGGDYLNPANVGFATKGKNHAPVMTQTVPAGKPNGQYNGAEVISVPGTNGGTSPYGAGYYETRMQPSCNGSTGTNPPTGIVASFFTIGVGYKSPEIDIEFLTDELGSEGLTNGTVHLTIHDPSGYSDSVPLQLPFNPCKANHRYGFLWSANGNVQYTVDGKTVLSNGNSVTSFSDAKMAPPSDGAYIMLNNWTGISSWGGVGVTSPAVTTYSWIRYGANVTSVPNW